MAKKEKNDKTNVTPIAGGPKYDAGNLTNFLEAYGPEMPVSVARIRDAGGPPVVREYKSYAHLNRELEALNGPGLVVNDATKQWNIYLSAARVRKGITKKATKEDVVSVSHLWVDLDPEKGDDWAKARNELLLSLTERLPEGVPRPTMIIDSGNGYWAFWRLEEPVEIPAYGEAGHEETIADVEAANNWLAKQSWAGSPGDSCFNIDRIFRAPGTINWPTKTKVAAGYQPRQATYLENRSDPTLVYRLDDFGRLVVEKKGPKKSKVNYTDEDVTPVTLDEIEERTTADIRGLVEGGPNETKPDRSKYVWAIACRMAEAGFTEAQIRYVLVHEDWWPSNHILEQNNPTYYANRTIDRAKTQVHTDSQKWKKDKYQKRDANSTHNLMKALGMEGLVPRYDVFADRLLIDGLEALCGTEQFGKDQEKYLAGLFGHKYLLEVSQTKLDQVVTYLAQKTKFDSLIEMIDGLPDWDNEKRADRIFIDYGGADDNKLNMAIGRNFLLAMMDRVYDPGGEVQFIPILEGPQDRGKSTFLRAIAMNPDFFTDSLNFRAEPKVVVEQTVGKWLIEIPELEGKGKSEDEAKKAMITRQVDRARLSYERRAVDAKRRFVLSGSTNHDVYLTDPTGNRRYWMISVGDDGKMLDCDRLTVDMPQIWAEVRKRYRNGERHDRRLGDELKADLTARQEKRRFPNADLQRLYELFGETGDKWAVHGRLTVGELNQIVTGSPNPRGDNYRIRDYKKGFIELGFVKTKVPIETGYDYDMAHGYYRNPSAMPIKELPRITLVKDARGEVIGIKGMDNDGNPTENSEPM